MTDEAHGATVAKRRLSRRLLQLRVQSGYTANHVCDMTDVAFTITEADKPGRVWDLAADVANDVQAGNPHADSHGHADTWSFVRGASKGGVGRTAPPIPPDSVLGRWRQAAADPARHGEVAKLLSPRQPSA